MSALDHIKWSESDYDMKDFVELFSYSLPVLCQTTTGYAGCDEDIHQVGADEIYWIYDILRQQRIVAKDIEGRYISIPVDKCKYKFQIVDEDNTRCSLVTPENLFENLKLNKSGKIRFMFEEDQLVSYQIGADIGNETKFGVMTLKESYEEKYLLGFGMHNGLLFCRTVGIPVYMDISFCRAIGFHEDEKRGLRFKRWTEELKTLIDSVEKTSINTCRAIIVFSERPSNGDYEYVRPNNFLVDSHNKSNKKQLSDDVINTSNEYSYIINREMSTHLQEPICTGKDSQMREESSDIGMTGNFEIMTKELPPMPRRCPPPPPHPAMDHRDEGANSMNPVERIPPAIPPAIPSRQSKSKSNQDCPRRMVDVVELTDQKLETSEQEMNSMKNTEESEFYEEVAFCSETTSKNHSVPFEINSAVSVLKVDSESPNGCSNEPNSTTSTTDALDSSSEDNASDAAATMASGRSSLSRLAIYSSAAQVPVDEDVDTWTVGDVTDVLRLLKLNQYIDVFSQQEIDGALLLNLDEKTLVHDFGFKQFEATKVVMFIRKGWRPK